MKRVLAGSVLLIVQVALVLSIAGKYLYERRTRPRIWVEATQNDPNQPLRGRYLALQLAVNVCGLPHDPAHYNQGYEISPGNKTPDSYHWSVALGVHDGRLVPRLEDHSRTPQGIQQVTQLEGQSCERVPLITGTEFFIPDTAKSPFPLKKGQEMWVEVTVPESGPPRPIQLAASDSDGFHPLRFE